MVTSKFIRYAFLFFGLALIPMNNYAEGQDYLRLWWKLTE